ncbi:MAG: hypothetical protein R6V35_04535 [Candidatus Nanohaloarchaea archaeon]
MIEKMDADLIEKYFIEEFPGALIDEEAYHLLLLILGEKPGALLLGVKDSDTEIIRDFCSDFDLEMKAVGGEKRSILDRILKRETVLTSSSIYIAEKKDRFDLLKYSEETDARFSDKAIGDFLGYPEDALRYYENEEIPGKAFQDKADFSNFSDEDFAYLNLVEYVPKPEEEEISKAIEEGKKREKLLKRLDNELDIEIGSKYLNEIKDNGKV